MLISFSVVNYILYKITKIKSEALNMTEFSIIVMVGDRFSNIDVLKCFFLIGEKGVISTKNLMFHLDADNTVVKQVIELLKKKKMLDSSTKGYSLSDRGKHFLDILQEYVSIPQQVTTPYYPDKKQVAVKVKTYKDIELKKAHKDLALKTGADSAIILKFNNRFSAEGIGFDEFDNLDTLFDFKFNNILIITFADTLRAATNSALTVAFNLDNRIAKELIEIENN